MKKKMARILNIAFLFFKGSRRVQEEMRQCPEERNSLRRLLLFSKYQQRQELEEDLIHDYEVDLVIAIYYKNCHILFVVNCIYFKV